MFKIHCEHSQLVKPQQRKKQTWQLCHFCANKNKFSKMSELQISGNEMKTLPSCKDRLLFSWNCLKMFSTSGTVNDDSTLQFYRQFLGCCPVSYIICLHHTLVAGCASSSCMGYLLTWIHYRGLIHWLGITFSSRATSVGLPHPKTEEDQLPNHTFLHIKYKGMDQLSTLIVEFPNLTMPLIQIYLVILCNSFSKWRWSCFYM
jgi:hypothetical protein